MNSCRKKNCGLTGVIRIEVLLITGHDLQPRQYGVVGIVLVISHIGLVFSLIDSTGCFVGLLDPTGIEPISYAQVKLITFTLLF